MTFEAVDRMYRRALPLVLCSHVRGALGIRPNSPGDAKLVAACNRLVSTRFRVADAYVEAKTRDAQGERWTARQRARFAYVELEVHQAVLGIPPLVIEEAV